MKVKPFIIIFLMLCQAEMIFADDELYLTGSDWCPYICTEVNNSQALSEKPGYLVEIIKQALKEYTIKYDSPSWERAIIETRKGTYDAIIGIYTSVVPDFIFPETEVGYSRMCFYVHKDNPWEYHGLESLSQIVLGVIEGYFYDEGKVDAYIKKHLKVPSRVEAIPGTRGLIQNLEKMLLGRITAIIDDQQVVEYTILSHNLPNVFKLAGCMEGIDVQIAFSPSKDHSKKLASKISSTTENLRNSGKLKKILDQYGIKDWKKY